jgi:hypothetical protein
MPPPLQLKWEMMQSKWPLVINYINNLTRLSQLVQKDTPLDPALYFNPGEIGVECFEDKNGRLVVISQNINPATLVKFECIEKTIASISHAGLTANEMIKKIPSN